jgi:hypothetical protein
LFKQDRFELDRFGSRAVQTHDIHTDSGKRCAHGNTFNGKHDHVIVMGDVEFEAVVWPLGFNLGLG